MRIFTDPRAAYTVANELCTFNGVTRVKKIDGGWCVEKNGNAVTSEECEGIWKRWKRQDDMAVIHRVSKKPKKPHSGRPLDPSKRY